MTALFCILFGIVLGIGAVGVFTANVQASFGMAFLAVIFGLFAIFAGGRPKADRLGRISEYERLERRARRNARR
jgi:hypothetical protein